MDKITNKSHHKFRIFLLIIRPFTFGLDCLLQLIFSVQLFPSSWFVWHLFFNPSTQERPILSRLLYFPLSKHSGFLPFLLHQRHHANVSVRHAQFPPVVYSAVVVTGNRLSWQASNHSGTFYRHKENAFILFFKTNTKKKSFCLSIIETKPESINPIFALLIKFLKFKKFKKSQLSFDSFKVLVHFHSFSPHFLNFSYCNTYLWIFLARRKFN